LREDLAASVRRHWAAVRGEIEGHFAVLWAEAELPNTERASAAALSDWLEDEGFQVERAACGSLGEEDPATGTTIAEQAIHHSREHPSHILLPLLPVG
jgi:metal-dependent amidase/aminoacylase/carboxypeptidase family protein